jgi:dipeptidyl aminopeptidase/acylaminoacyl peptidase
MSGIQQVRASGTVRPVTMADAITMTRLADPDYVNGADSQGRVAQFSPDGKQFVIIVRRGNLEQNTNEYEMLLWRCDRIGDQSFPRRILKMESSSNRPAIENVTWLADNRTVAFLGEQPEELHQVYAFDTETAALRKVTNHTTNIVSYGISPDGTRVAFIAEPPTKPLFDLQARHGALVTSQPLIDLLLNRVNSRALLLWFRDDSGYVRQLSVPETASYFDSPALSPDGRFIAVRAVVSDVPPIWKSYSDTLLQDYTKPAMSKGQDTWLSRYAVVDTQTGKSRFLLNSPVRSVNTLIAWSPDSKSVVLAGAYLPLENTYGEERRLRESKSFAVEVNPQDGSVTKISREDQIIQKFTNDYERSLRWDRQSHCVVFGFSTVYPVPGVKPQVDFCKTGGGWRVAAQVPSESAHPTIILEEGMNMPPRVFASDKKTQEKQMLYDLNPNFAKLQFGHVEEIEWQGYGGHAVKGGLYFPVGYQAGKRYPLVIQTHFWTRKKFWIDGPWTTTFAAQPLAGKEIMVLQVDESEEDLGKFREIRRESANLDAAVDDLNRRGLIDPERVGIIGFSRTCLFVEYALTHSNHHFRAAAIADGVDDGYFQYLMFANSSPVLTQYTERANGGKPYGDGLDSWKRRASGFNLQRVNAPVRIMARNPESVLLEWEWFAGLTLLQKPVEMVYIQDGTHILQKPWDRLTSQDGNVDWFAFWLNGDEDSDPEKADQFTRWRQMRERQLRKPSQLSRDRKGKAAFPARDGREGKFH